ncbi:MAG: oligoribonuclease [Polyangiaceae bacterium]
MARNNRLVWVDLEMTGLDPETNVIVEIATIVTEEDLSIVAEGPNIVIHQPDAILDTLDPVVLEMHTKSGLIDRIRQSDVTLERATHDTLAFIREHVDARTAPLAGNSVWKDKQFLERYMGDVVASLHYRLVDVSTVKELARRWYPAIKAPKKKESHRALDDIRESIAELQFYREKIFAK